ncbi:MAG TPA: hypothetical protein VKZ18_13770 [Polyangia bacterium]|nr:hypothetical protein [Polyangia bacterium]
MTQGLAGIAGNSCPLCGELTDVPVVNVLVLAWNSASFRCSACTGRIRVASSTRAMGFLGSVLGIAVAVWIYFHFFAWFDRAAACFLPKPWRGFFLAPLPVAMGFGGYVLGGIPPGRWTMLLEPMSESRP